MAILAIAGGATFVFLVSSTAAQTVSDPQRNRVILVAGICSGPDDTNQDHIDAGDFATSTSEGGAGVPEHNFGEIRKWLQNDLGYNDVADRADGKFQQLDEIVYFSYRENNTEHDALPYSDLDTLNSIDGTAAPSSGYLLTQLIGRMTPNEGEKVDIIAHSQGGVVALWAALSTTTEGRIGSIVTIESPLQGVDWLLWLLLASFLGDAATDLGIVCADEFSPSVVDMLPISPVIDSITAENWASKPRPRVINISSVSDPIVADSVTLSTTTTNFVCCGEKGLLDSVKVHKFRDAIDAGGGLVDAHQFPLDVQTNAIAIQETRQAILEGLLIDTIVLGHVRGEAAFAGMRIPLPQPKPLSTGYVGNESASVIDQLPNASPDLRPRALTESYVGNDDQSSTPALSNARLLIAPVTSTASYVGNDDSSFEAGLIQPPKWASPP